MVAPAATATTFGKYTLVAKLATGGMAEIFLARGVSATGVERYVVLKRIIRDRANDVQLVKMFLDEARLAAQLGHPNVVHIYDFGKVDEHYFIAMEYVDSVHADREQLLAGPHRLREVLRRPPAGEQKPPRPPAPHIRPVRGQVPDSRRK